MRQRSRFFTHITSRHMSIANCVCRRSSRWLRWEWYYDGADKVTTTSKSASWLPKHVSYWNIPAECTSHHTRCIHHDRRSTIDDKSEDSWGGRRNTVDVHGDIGIALLLLATTSMVVAAETNTSVMKKTTHKRCRWESIKQQRRITKRIILKMAVLWLSRKYQSAALRRDRLHI